MATLQNGGPVANALGGGIPANFTKDQLQATYARWHELKAQGVQPDNPEFVKIQHLLTAVQRQSQLKKVQQQNYKEQLARQGLNTAQAPNGQPSVDETNSPAPQPAATTQDNQSVATPVSATAPAARAALVGHFTQDQINLLRSQIFAFKQIGKNLPIPPEVRQRLFAQPSLSRKVSSEAPPPAVNGHAETQSVPPAEKEPTPRPQGEGQVSLRVKAYPEINKISYQDHSLRAARPILGGYLPIGVDVEKLREERERSIYNRIMARRAELENLPATIAEWDTSKSETPVLTDKLKLKALIEYKMLCLLPKQKALRQQISRDVLHFDNLAQTCNRSNYRRPKRQTLREARITEKLEQQQRDARETKEKKKQTDQIRDILAHAKNIRDNAANQKARAQKLGRMMQTQHQQIEKEEQKRIERTAKQRLQALKNDDEATYLKLLGQAKDSRISHLLTQTDGFLNQLASSVRQQQRTAAERYGNTSLQEEDITDEEDEEGDSKVDYYEVAHRVKEEVKAQASILVGGTLKEYQIKGLQWMISLYNNSLNGILADEMGLGKTIQTLSLITYLIEKKKQNGPYLVIVPLSTLTNWDAEFSKWAPSVQKVTYKGPPQVRKNLQNQIRYGQFQVLLTTYEYIIKDRPILSKIKWIHMIIDEGHRMKNTESKLSATLSQYYHTRYRLILTGTPLQNNLPELWALLNFVLPSIFKSVKSFDEWFNTPFANTGSNDKMELTEEESLLVIRRLHKVLRPFLLRRLKKDVEKDLPDKTEKVVRVKFSALQTKLYKQLMNNNQLNITNAAGNKVPMRGLSNMLMQLRKLCNHPFVFEQVEDEMNPDRLTNDLLWRTAGKFELLDRVLPKFQATGHRVLIFFQMTQIMNIMEDFLRLRGLTYLRLDGATKSEDRSELLRLFNAPDSPYFCFLLSTRAGGLGLNLQTADTVIIYDSDWNPFQDLQAQDRAHRIGQKNEVRILRLISSNSVEEKILERAQYKLAIDEKVIQAGKFDNKTTNEERETLLRALYDSAEAAEALNDQEEMDDDELNQDMARNDDELEIFRQMDIERAKDPVYGTGPGKLPRLMQESELPEIFLNEDAPAQNKEEDYAGRGARERTRVKYDDGLTEEQWLNAVDDDSDTIEAAVARKRARIEKRQANKAKRDAEDDSPVGPSRQSTEEVEVEPTPKKRSRKSGGAVKRKLEEEPEIETPPVKKKKVTIKAGKNADPLEPEVRSALQDVLQTTYTHLMDMEEETEVEAEEEGGSPQVQVKGLIDPFVKLVPKQHYPDYYLVITNPISMDMIQKRINKNEYTEVNGFWEDIKLLCKNAMTYNEDGSWLYQDAEKIQAEAEKFLTEQLRKHSNLESPFADGNVKSERTDTPSGSGPRIKLTVGGASSGAGN